MNVVLKRREEEHREKFILSAFTAFHLGAGEGLKFGDYLIKIGLSEDKLEEMTPEQIKVKTKEIIERLRNKK